MLKLQKVFEVSVPPPNGGLVYYYNRNKNQDIKTYVFPLLFSFPAPAVTHKQLRHSVAAVYSSASDSSSSWLIWK